MKKRNSLLSKFYYLIFSFIFIFSCTSEQIQFDSNNFTLDENIADVRNTNLVDTFLLDSNFYKLCEDLIFLNYTVIKIDTTINQQDLFDFSCDLNTIKNDFDPNSFNSINEIHNKVLLLTDDSVQYRFWINIESSFSSFLQENSNYLSNFDSTELYQAIDLAFNNILEDNFRATEKDFSRDPCAMCDADYAFCMELAMGSYAANLSGDIAAGVVVGAGVSYFGTPAAGIPAGIVTFLGGAIGSTFSYSGDTWQCSRKRNRCLQTHNCGNAGGGGFEPIHTKCP